MAQPATRDRAVAASETRPRVLYVMGAGRSGSTILGVTMGNCAGVFYAGELDAWLARAGDPQLHDAERMRFWSAVRENVEGTDGLFGRDAQRALERSAVLFRVHLWPARRRLRTPYRRVSESLYRAIAHATGAGLIVDSSHYPLRARELQRVDGIDLHLLYLARDPQSVVASFKRTDVPQYSKSTLTTNVYLWVTNLLATLVFLRHPRERRSFVRYEDFLADPDTVVRSVLDQAGVTAPLPDFTHLATGVAFQGNRLISAQEISLDGEPAGAAPRSWITAALQLPWRVVLSRLRPRAGSRGRRS